jgi:hypothetical protein
MKSQKLDCGCVVVTDRRGTETLPRENMCPEHGAFYDQAHAAAIASCSHVHRERQP